MMSHRERKKNKMQKRPESGNSVKSDYLQIVAEGANANVCVNRKKIGLVVKIVNKNTVYRRMISLAKLVHIIKLVEARTIDSKHLISITHFKVIDQISWQYYIVMEQAQMTILQFISKNLYNPKQYALFNFALNNLHKHNLSYNDLKPENILLKGNTVKFCDLQSITSILDECNSQVGNTVYSHSEKLAYLTEYAEKVQKYEMHSLSLILFQLYEGEIKMKKKTNVKSLDSNQQIYIYNEQAMAQSMRRKRRIIPLQFLQDLIEKEKLNQYQLFFQKLKDQPQIQLIIENLFYMRYESLGQLLESNEIRMIKQRLPQKYKRLTEEDPSPCANEFIQKISEFVTQIINEDMRDKENKLLLPHICNKESKCTCNKKNNVFAELIANIAKIQCEQTKGQEIKIRKVREIANFFIQADKNHDGKISFKEFKAFYSGIRDKETGKKESIMRTFNTIDEDKNGSISIKEYSNLFVNILSKENLVKLQRLLHYHYPKI